MSSTLDDPNIFVTTNVVTATAVPSSIPASSSKGVAAAPIVGGILGGIVIAVVAVAMIVPCARRRQRRLRDPGNGFAGPRVLRKVVDAEASEPMMKGSWRDHILSSEDDRMRSTESGHTGIPQGYIEPLPMPNFQSLQPVTEGVVMAGGPAGTPYLQNFSAPHFPHPMPPPPRQHSRSMIPRFPSLDKLWPLTTAFRSSLYSAPSTKTKSSGGSSVPSGRGRDGETKQINPDALVSPTVLGQEVRLGKGRIPVDMEIKHSNPANEVRYQTAPMHRGYSLQSSASMPPNRREPPTIYAQQRPAYFHNPEPQPPRRQPSDSSNHRHHRRQKSNEYSRSHNHQSSTRHHRQNSVEHPARPHRSRSRSRSRNDPESARRPKPDSRRGGSSTAKVYNYTGYPS